MGRTCQIVSVESARKNSDDVRSGILTEMCPEHIKTHIHLILTRLPNKHSLKHDSRVRILMRWTQSERVFVAIVDRKVIGRQVVPNVARVVVRVMMARDRARRASQAKAKLMTAKDKAKVASGKHAKYLMDTAISVGNGDVWQRSRDTSCDHFETIVMTGNGKMIAK